jgi:hypothetical protein
MRNCCDRHHTLWVATDFGLNRFYPATEEFRKYAPRQTGLTYYRSVAEKPGGVLWLATSSHGLRPPDTDAVRHVPLPVKSGRSCRQIVRGRRKSRT